MALIETTEAPQVTTPADWLHFLFGTVESGYITLFSIDRTTGKKCTDWFSVDDLDAAGARALELAETRCVWFGIATRRERLPGNKRGGGDDCVVIVALWLDIDTVHPVHEQDNLPPDTDTALGIVRRFPIPPTAINDTGHGIQPFWILEEPVEVAELGDTLARWHHTWTRLAEPYHLDKTSDVPRVLRVPGTVNRKADPVPVEIIEADWSRLHGITDIVDQLDELPEPEPARPRRDPGEGLPGHDYNDRHDGGELLEEIGCTLDRTDRNGDRHYCRPGRKSGETGATVYANDGHTTIYSTTLAQRHGLETNRPYDPFGLFAAIHHAGDHRAAAQALAADGYGSDPEDELLALISPELLAAARTATDADTAEVPADAVVARQVTVRSRPAGEWLFEETVERPAIWGRDDEILWPDDEGVINAAPTGVGKTTLATLLAQASMGLGSGEVLGYPVTECDRVLYLAMDRPAQIRRAMRRLFSIEDTGHLNERLVIRPGPLPADLGRHPEILISLATEVGANRVFIDSVKDCISKVSDDESGGNFNRAIQLCNAEHIPTYGLHHQRKGNDGNRPDKLEDVYGSTWITAGAGSVLLLWGEPGTGAAELRHLKTPSTPVGPLQVEIDTFAGTMTTVQQWDPLAWLRHRGDTGGTVPEAAQAMVNKAPTRADKERARRKLDALVKRGLARKRGGAERVESPRYVAVEIGL